MMARTARLAELSRICLAALLICVPHVSAQAADTTLNAHGGSGGKSFISRCPPGQFMVGMTLRTGSAVDQAAPICGRWSAEQQTFLEAEPAAAYGGHGGNSIKRSCKHGNEAITHLKVVFDDDYVRGAAFTCRNDKKEGTKEGFATTNMCETAMLPFHPVVILSGRNPCFAHPAEDLTCPKGQAAVGLHGRAEGLVDSLGLLCAPFDRSISSPPSATNIYYKPTLPNGLRVDACLKFKEGCGQPAADRYCQLRGRSGATKFENELVGGWTPTTDSNTTMSIGDTRFCGNDWCAGFKSITCSCKPRALQNERFEQPRVEATGRRLDWCSLWGGKDCGQKPADSFCNQKGYGRAGSFELEPNVGRQEPTQLFGQQVNTVCDAKGCAGFRFIECTGSFQPTNCPDGLAAKSQQDCTGGMVKNREGLCGCPYQSEWKGDRCVKGPPLAGTYSNSGLTLPSVDPKEKFRNSGLTFPSVPPSVVHRVVCKPPRPNGTPPNCCPERTAYSNGMCRYLTQIAPKDVVSTTGKTCAGRACCPAGTLYRSGVCRRIVVDTFRNPPAQIKTGPGKTAITCSGSRPVGRPPNCCPAGTRYTMGKCRRGFATTNPTGGGGGGGGGCPAHLPVGRPPYCCPSGTSFSSGACRRPATAKQGGTDKRTNYGSASTPCKSFEKRGGDGRCYVDSGGVR